MCAGKGWYDYEVGPLGWQPFRCPTCAGAKFIPDATDAMKKKSCFTCKGTRMIDPADAPGNGIWDIFCKTFLGA